MGLVQIKWNSLLNLSELQFIPEQPHILKMSDEMIQTIAWLTGATGHDRRLLRCTDEGALLIADAWSNMAVAENDELYPESASTDTFTATVPNKGVLIVPAMYLIKATFVRVSGGSSESIYIPVGKAYWYPHSVYSVECAVVPDPDGLSTYVGITAFN